MTDTGDDTGDLIDKEITFDLCKELHELEVLYSIWKQPAIAEADLLDLARLARPEDSYIDLLLHPRVSSDA